MTRERYSQHISRQYNLELEEVKTHLLEMGGVVEKQLALAIESLLEANSAIAQHVCDDDHEVNKLELEIDEECARILARRQPAAGDLRLVIAISRLNADLERIGDEAAKIAKQAILLSETGAPARGYAEIRQLGELVSVMLHNALDAFARLDTELALSVASEDQLVDSAYNTALQEMVAYMSDDPRQIKRSLNVIWILRCLERIGDHSRNISEHVIYLVLGKDVRHMDIEEMEIRARGG